MKKKINEEVNLEEEDEVIKKIAFHIKEIIKALGEDVNREGLVKTPLRVAKAYSFLTSGFHQESSVEKIMSEALFNNDYSEIVLVKDIEFYSLCEHHMLPFYGKAHVAYIPDGKVIGISKIPRIVEVYARRLQIQEQMTIQIRDAIQNHLNPQGVGVVIEAHHMCLMLRGVQKQASTTVTSALSGVFLDDLRTREEFLNLIHKRF